MTENHPVPEQGESPASARTVGGTDQTSTLLKRTLRGLIEGATGIAASEKKDLLVRAGHLFQRMRAGTFLSDLMKHWEELRERGRIKDDYVETDQHYECFQELLAYLDTECIDRIRFEVLRRIALAAATETLSSRTSLLPQQYMRVCRSLSSGETLVLLGTHQAAKTEKLSRPTSAADWLLVIAKTSGLELPELVELNERTLIEKNLLTPRRHPDCSGVELGKHFRLTDLGNRICEFIEAGRALDADTKPDV